MKKGKYIYTFMAVLFMVAPIAWGQTANTCEGAEFPDIIVGAIYDKARYGTLNGITGFAIGTESCNIGTCWANWLSGTPFHPVIGQNMFRLKNGRFEQIGQGWLKHGFATLDDNLCGQCIDADGQHLGVNCSDPYGAGLNGSQSNLGPKFEINVGAGTHLHPFTAQGQSGNAIYKRIQVHNVDLDPAQNPGALYFVEAQYVAADDAAAGKNWNNASYRDVNVTGSGTTFDFSLTGVTQQQLPAIRAWQFNDPSVTIRDIDFKYVGGTKVTNLGGGMWHYEYALQNLISHQGARNLRIPIPRGGLIANVGFHDVDYHSGEPWDGTDWTVSIDTSTSPHYLVWSTQTQAENPNANALRWGTLYNFRFDINYGPVTARALIGPFIPGTEDWKWVASAPNRCGDAFCDTDESAAACPGDCADLGDAGAVPDGLSTPGAQLLIGREPNGDLTLSWDASCAGGDADYEIYEGAIGDFTSHVRNLCSTGGLTEATLAAAAGDRYYLVVPNNGLREGSYGVDSLGNQRPQGFPACMTQSYAACQ